MLPFRSNQNAAAERTQKSDSVEGEKMMETTKRTGILAGIERDAIFLRCRKDRTRARTGL